LSVLFQLSSLTVVAHTCIVSGTMLRVIMKRPATGVALAWLLIVATIPVGGVLLYLLVGERRVGEHRAKRIERLRLDFDELSKAAIRDPLTNVDWSRHPPAAYGLDRIGRSLVRSRTLRGSEFELLHNAEQVLAEIARDVDHAQKSVLMEFYIWNAGGAADVVLQAVIRAARRGVVCRILVDAVGGRPWWKGPQPAELRAAGVQVVPALPVRLLPVFGGRTDLRLHRKIVIIDAQIAWTGSMNLVDPRFFKQDAGVGEWVDAMVRLKGSAVAALAATLIGDWVLETDDSVQGLIDSAGLHAISPRGNTDIQVVPSGPRTTTDGLLQMLLGLVNAARSELIITTPYFVPDDALLYAVRGAASRGVRVMLVVPGNVDSLMTRHASRSFYDDLLDVGVEIHLYRDGLLHTKSITVDGAIAMFGTVNIDMRSLWLNYEVSLFVYGQEFAAELRTLQQSYLNGSDRLNPQEWRQRPFSQRLLENTMRLVSPLL
jgi:cardiolipin synthase